MPYISEIILNFIFIQLSIVAFVTPFYLVFKYKNPGVFFKHLVLNKHIENFLSSKQANYLVFVWAAAEAIAWFIIPEFLLLLVIFLRVKNKRALLLYDIFGTIFGTISGLIISIYTNFSLLKVPYVAQGMISQVQSWYGELGVFGLFFQPFSGVPYKVFVFSAHFFNINLVMFIIVAVMVRMARYFIFYLIFVELHPFLHRFISRNYIPVLLVSCFIFSTLLLRVYNVYDHDYIINGEGSKNMEKIILQIKDKLD